MTAKQYLQNYRRIEGKYNAALEEYKSVEQDVISLKSPGFDERVQSSMKNDPIGDIVIRLEDQRGKIGLQIVNYRAQMLVIHEQITATKKADEDYCVILLLRYVLYKDWKFICKSINVSRAQANILHGKALQEFDRIFAGKYQV